MPATHVIPAVPSLFDEPPPQGPVLSLGEARGEDAHWEGSYSRERYYRPGREYEDYAPAYCAGYVGFAQYGGSFEDAERSLVSNWLRIRGDSRLDLEEAGLAMRAAWHRMEQRALDEARWREWTAVGTDGSVPAPQDADADGVSSEMAFMQLAGTRALPNAQGLLTARP